MTQPVDAADRISTPPTERRATPPYGLLAVLSGQDIQAVRERPELLQAANDQLGVFVSRYFDAGATPTEAEVRARVAAELARYAPAIAGPPNLGTMRASLVERLGARPDAQLVDLLAAAERRWPSRMPQTPTRNLVSAAPALGVQLQPPRPIETVPPRAVEAEQSRLSEQQRAAEREARRQRDLADIIDLWRTLPSDGNIHPVQKDEYRAHTLTQLEGLYGSRAAGLQAVAAIDPGLANEMDRWVRPPLYTNRR